ncbi:uncharacterized protein L201_000843 [Kwoniella dendrophila CBS 6074]|uniref:RGS domain-containing protein n=1 Tax=Kwoniella dendrophila CBS 6074 TaxID=1295534 RepID=A0AAX4JMA2_9TREE
MLESTELTKSEIPIEASSRDLGFFLDYISSGSAEDPKQAEDWMKLLDMIDKYDCPIIKKRFKTRLQNYICKSAWEGFCVASHIKDTSLAKEAIRRFGQEEISSKVELGKLSLSEVEKPTLAHLLGLLQAKEKNGYVRDWEAIAEPFVPLS